MRANELWAPRALAWLAIVVLSAIAAPASAHPPEAESFAEPPVVLKVIAPSAKGPWLLRIDNEGDEPVRIAADVRLLTFEIRAPSAPKTPKSLTYRQGWERRAASCKGPEAFGIADHFPGGRELVLEPGHSYVEEFDPRLICFGADAKLLVPGAMVKPYYGWVPNKKPWMKMSVAPFVADAAKVPRRFKPLRRLEAPTMILSHAPPVKWGPEEAEATETDRKEHQAAKEAAAAKAAKEGAPGATSAKSNGPASGAAKEGGKGNAADKGGPKPSAEGTDGQGAQPGGKPGEKSGDQGPRSAEAASRHRPQVPAPQRPPPPKDELGAALTLTTYRYADSHHASDIVMNVQAHNVGERPIFVALRSRMLSFVIAGPNGIVKCPRPSQNHKVPRDLFGSLQHDKHVHMVVLLAEVCPPGTFERPGLYAAVPTLHADATGAEYGLEALTGVVTVRDPGDPSGTHLPSDDVTLIRKRRGNLPFYQRPPSAIPTRVLPE